MDVWGEEFEAMYTRLEKEGKGRKTMKVGGRHDGLQIILRGGPNVPKRSFLEPQN